MARSASFCVTLALCALTVAACGNSLKLEDLDSANVSSSCDRLVRCGAVSSHDVCVAVLSRFFSTANLEAGVKNGAVSYDGDKAADCLDAISNQSCDPSTRDARVTPQSCKDAVKGNHKDGDACFFDVECVSESCSVPSSCGMTCCAGTCDPTPPAPAAIGAACSTGGCVDGAYCNGTTCAALLASGQPCQGNGSCDYGLICVGATTPTCTKPPQAGDPCTTQGNQSSCSVLGLVCDATQHCVKRIGKGGTCDPSAPLCQEDLVCDATAKTCNAPPAIGQPCTGACAAGAFCATTGTGPGTCTALEADGHACTADGECNSNYCDTTTQLCAVAPVCA